MKKFLVVLAMLLPLVSFAQQEDNDSTKKQSTKYEEFVSKTGSFIKFIDINQSKMNISFATSIETSVRTFISPSKAHFFRIESASALKSGIAMIEYMDLVEINKALPELYSEAESDIAANPEYLENKFRTVDGFEIGYYISKKKANWWMRLEWFSSHLDIKNENVSAIIDAFKNAQAKIEELKANGN